MIYCNVNSKCFECNFVILFTLLFFITTFMLLSLLIIWMCPLQYNSRYLWFIVKYILCILNAILSFCFCFHNFCAVITDHLNVSSVSVIYCNVNFKSIECSFIILFTLLFFVSTLLCYHYSSTECFLYNIIACKCDIF